MTIFRGRKVVSMSHMLHGTGTFAYIWLKLMVNASTYSIYGASGCGMQILEGFPCFFFRCKLAVWLLLTKSWEHPKVSG